MWDLGSWMLDVGCGMWDVGLLFFKKRPQSIGEKSSGGIFVYIQIGDKCATEFSIERFDFRDHRPLKIKIV